MNRQEIGSFLMIENILLNNVLCAGYNKLLKLTKFTRNNNRMRGNFAVPTVKTQIISINKTKFFC